MAEEPQIDPAAPVSRPSAPEEYRVMVLVVDDDPHVNRLVRAAIAEDPTADYHYCARGAEAMAAALQVRPTVILQDLRMPGTDGLDLVRQYRARPELEHVPVVVLSGMEDPELKRDAFLAGANDFLVKLPDPIELHARLQYHSHAYLNRLQRDIAFRSLRESQRQLERLNAELERRVEERTAEVRQSEERFRLLLDSAAEAVYGLDLEGRCTFCNPAALRMLGFASEQELLGRNVHQLIHPRRADGTPCSYEDCPIHQAFRKGESTHVQREAFWRPDGTSFPVECWSYPMWSGGAVVGAVVTFLDITERKHAEQALQESQQQLLNLNEALLRRMGERDQIALSNVAASIVAGEVPALPLAPPTLPLEDPARLRLLRSTGLMDSAAEESFDRLTRMACELFHVPIALVSLVDTRRQFFKSAQGLPEPWAELSETPLSHSFCQHVVNSGEPLVLDDVVRHPKFCRNPAVVDFGARAYLGIPLTTKEGFTLGSFCIIDTAPRRWSDKELARMKDLAAAVLDEIELRLATRKSDSALGALLEMQERMHLAIEAGRIGTWDVDLQSGATRSSTLNDQMLGFPEGHTLTDQQEWRGRLHPEDRARVQEAFRQAAAQKGDYRAEYRTVSPQGALHWVEARGTILFDPVGKPLRAIGVSRDVTERKETEAALQAQRAFLRQVIDTSPNFIFTKDRGGRFTLVNASLARAYGHTSEEMLGRTDADFNPDAAQVARFRQDDLEVMVQCHEKLIAEEMFRGADGRIRWLHTVKCPLVNAEGVATHVLGVSVDITERKEAAELLHAALAEKESLLREIHHRVKNNMQVIASLFQLQSRYVKDERLLAQFREGQDRIRSMALIHEKLYQSKSLAEIDFAGYLRELVGMLQCSYQTHATPALDLRLEPVHLPVDTAIPIGLIVNELVTNCFKYAFPAGRAGKVTIELRAGEGRQWLVAVRDDGVGLPLGFNFATVETLGLRLVRILARQIGGEVHARSSHTGTEVRLQFEQPQ